MEFRGTDSRSEYCIHRFQFQKTNAEETYKAVRHDSLIQSWFGNNLYLLQAHWTHYRRGGEGEAEYRMRGQKV